MIEFKIAPHTHRAGEVVECLLDGKVVAVIYPTPTGIKLLSRYIQQIDRAQDYGLDELNVWFNKEQPNASI